MRFRSWRWSLPVAILRSIIPGLPVDVEPLRPGSAVRGVRPDRSGAVDRDDVGRHRSFGCLGLFRWPCLFSLIGINVYELPVPADAGSAFLAWAWPCGAMNGVLIGYLRLRAFLTTLVTLIIFRSIYEIVFLRMSTSIMSRLFGFRSLALHRRGHHSRHPDFAADHAGDRARLAYRAVAHAARLATDRRWRRPPLGL